MCFGKNFYHKGRRMLNVTVMKAMGIAPKPEILVNTEIVGTERNTRIED